MLSKEKVAEKSLAKLMQYLKNEEISLQNKIPLIQARLNYNRIMQTILLKIVSMEEKKEKQEEEKLEERQEQEKLVSLHKKEKKKKQKDLQKKMLGKCLFKERGSSKFCGRKTVKGSDYCTKHIKELSGSRDNQKRTN